MAKTKRMMEENIKLVDVVVVLLILVILPKGNANLRHCYTGTVSIHKKSQQFFGLGALENQPFAVNIRLKIAKAFY